MNKLACLHMNLTNQDLKTKPTHRLTCHLAVTRQTTRQDAGTHASPQTTPLFTNPRIKQSVSNTSYMLT